jgi:hypothetical protein
MSSDKKRNRLTFLLVVSMAAFGAPGCSADYAASPTPAPQLAGMQLHYSRPHTFVAPGSFLTFTLYAINTDGVMENVTGRATWSPSDPRVLATGGAGTMRAVADGAADVIATYQGFVATARVVVARARSFPYVELTPAPTHEAGVTSQAAAMFVQGTTRVAVADQATWTSSDPSVLTVDRGAVTGQGPGTAAITAVFNGLPSTYYASVPPLRALP